MIQEWLDWSRRLSTASLFEKADFKAAAMALPEEVVQELGAFYERAAQASRVAVLADWLRARPLGEPMGDDEKGVRNLVTLFGHIARCWGRRPFTERPIRSSDLPPPEPDWSKLPAGWEFLGPPALTFSRFEYEFSEIGREQIQSAVTPAEREELRAVAEGVRRVGFGAVKQWCSRMGVLEHVEASMVFGLLGVLDALELPYY